MAQLRKNQVNKQDLVQIRGLQPDDASQESELSPVRNHNALDANNLMRLQRLVGNQQTQRLVRGGIMSQTAVQRSPTKTPRRRGGTEHVGGDSSQVTFLPAPDGEVIGPGEAGFSRRMLTETVSTAESLSEGYSDYLLTNVVPNTQEARQQIATRAREQQNFREKADGFNNGPSVRRTYTAAADWCQTHMNQIQEDIRQEDEKGQRYNAWVPRANSFFTSLSRLDAMQEMLGVSDPYAMVSALTQGLSDAQAVGERMQLASDRGQSEVLQVPEADQSLVQLSNQTTLAAQQMNTAYIGFQQTLLAREEQDVHAEGNADRAKLQQINEVKQFVRNVGRTVDVTISVVSGAPAAIANAREVVLRSEASLNAIRNRRQVMRGERQTHNPTYVTTDADGNMIVRNMQTMQDRQAISGETSSTPEQQFQLPTSVSGILDTLTNFAYSSEVQEINARLEQIKSRCQTVQLTRELSNIIERTQNFQDKLNNFAQKCAELQQRMEQRRQEYLEFGVQLDRFAQQNAATRRAGQAPDGRESERYATIMTVVSQIREVLAVGRGITGGFETPQEFRVWAQGIHANRTENHPSPNISYMTIPDSEWNALDKIYGQVSRANFNINQVTNLFNPVEIQARTLMSALHQGGGRGEY